MRAAIVDQGVVVNVIEVETPEDFNAVPCPPEVGPGWTLNNDQFTQPQTQAPDATSEMIDAELARRLASGLTYSGHVYELDERSQQRITSAGTQARFAVLSGAVVGDFLWHGGAQPFVWITKDNLQVQMDAQTMSDFAEAALMFVLTHRVSARNLKDMNPIPQDFRDDKYWP